MLNVKLRMIRVHSIRNTEDTVKLTHLKVIMVILPQIHTKIPTRLSDINKTAMIIISKR